MVSTDKGFRLYFSNGYGVSVVKHEFSYGGPQGFAELAVLTHEDGKRSDLCYTTAITGDVLGHLTDDEVSDLIARVKALPAR